MTATSTTSSPAGTRAAFTPVDEARRLDTLRNLGLLDSAPSASFDRATRLAADLLQVPIVLISLVDENRQWFKSKIGLSATETSRQMSFCAHAVFDRKPLVVPDATRDARFVDNPLVIGTPYIRSYLGIPIFSREGHAIGTLCAIDTAVRAFTDLDVRKLTDCTELVEELIHSQELAKSTKDILGLANEREQRFQCLVSLTSQVIWTNSAEGRMEGEQPGWGAFTGQTFDQYQGFGWSAAVHPEDAQPSVDEWNNCVAAKSRFLFEHRVRRHDGVYRICSIDAAPILNADGSIREWVGVHHDITERRRQEEEIRAQEANFRFLADAVPQMVWTARPDGIADYYNQQWFSYTGMTRRQAERGDWGPIHPDDVQNSTLIWRQSVENGEPYQVEHRFKRITDGAYRWHLCRAVRLQDDLGGTVKWFGTCTDIHDYKEAEARNLGLQAELEDRVRLRTCELESANRDLKLSSGKLERSNRELQDFASVASHDLQEPLRKVQAFGDRLKVTCSAGLDSQGLDYLNRMLNATSRMHTLIQDLLTFSRVNSRPREFVAVDLARVTREVLTDLEVRIADSAAQVHVSELPIIEADPMLMRQLLQNLVGNALKFHAVGRPPVVRVRVLGAVEPSNRQDLCTLIVEDEGIGFDEKYLDRIFTVFQRLHGRNEYEGTGIGLAICRKIAWRHGGDITASSSPGGGAKFTVTLPRHQLTGVTLLASDGLSYSAKSCPLDTTSA